MDTRILRLNKAGTPTGWIDRETAATVISKGLMLWSMGSLTETLHGGVQRATQERSQLDIPSIIAVDGRIKEKKVPKISNKLLFVRDQHMCMYCGETFSDSKLTRDHVFPQSRNGPNVWENCVAACRRCNHAKDDRTPEEAGMPLLALPYAPNHYEYIYLENKNVLADQMEYLKSKFQNLEVA